MTVFGAGELPSLSLLEVAGSPLNSVPPALRRSAYLPLSVLKAIERGRSGIIAVQAWNGSDLMGLTTAALRAGWDVLLLSPVYSTRDTATILNQSGCDLLVTCIEHESFDSWRWINLGDESGLHYWRGPGEARVQPLGGIWFTTSGSTGTPKISGAPLRGLLDNAFDFATEASYTESDGIVCLSPWSHVYGFVAGWLGAFTAGTKLYWWDGPLNSCTFPLALKNLIRPTIIAVPTMIRRAASESWRTQATRARFVLSGEPVPDRISNFITQTLGAECVNCYGTTESLIALVGNSADKNSYLKPLKGIDAAVSAEGHLWLRSHYKSGTWFDSEDIAVLASEPHQHYEIVGRANRIINVGGRKTHPAEIELAIEHACGVDAIVVGHPDQLYGERPLAYIERVSVSALEQRLHALHSALTAYKLPMEWRTVQKFPTLSNGKIDMKGLRACRYETLYG